MTVSARDGQQMTYRLSVPVVDLLPLTSTVEAQSSEKKNLWLENVQHDRIDDRRTLLSAFENNKTHLLYLKSG